jgi:hypothetical protein
MKKRKPAADQIIGWREWVGLPELGIPLIKAKVDTGARSSSLHAVNVKKFTRDGETWVRFQVHPIQRSSEHTVEVEAVVIEERTVRSSSGNSSLRPVILTHVTLLGKTWPIEITLAARDDMGFRMLLGREAVRGKFFIDPKASYYGGSSRNKKREQIRFHS